MKISRTSRLNGEFQKEISAVISRDLKDREPSLSGVISVTEADIAPDLKTAKIYISIYGSEEQREESFSVISDNAGFIRHCLAQRMRIRTIPSLTFYWDGSMEYGSKMDRLLSSVHKEEENTHPSSEKEE